jgi:hypothetical protein
MNFGLSDFKVKWWIKYIYDTNQILVNIIQQETLL